MSGGRDLNVFTLAPKSMLLISMPKKKKKDFKAFLSTNGRVGITAMVGEVQGIYS